MAGADRAEPAEPAPAGRRAAVPLAAAAAARADGWAIVVLAVGGFTDWLDGKLARLLNQYSRLGALLDPAVDRLYILAALVGARRCATSCRGGRSACWSAATWCSAACLPVLRRRGYGPYRVSYLGKAPRSCCSTPSRCCCSAGDRALRRPVARPLGLRVRGLGDRALPLLRGALPRPVRAGAAQTRAPRIDRSLIARVVGSRRDPRGPALHRGPRVGARSRRRRGAGRHHRPRPAPARRRRVRPAARRSATTSRRARRVGEVESTKSVSDIYAPVSGTVVGGQRRAGRHARS